MAQSSSSKGHEPMNQKFTEATPLEILSFDQFSNQSIDEQVDDPYDPAIEKLPYDPWYALDIPHIERGVSQPCDILLNVTKSHCDSDGEIFKFHNALQSVRVCPRGKPLNVAFLGDQGIGKSSIINQLFDRVLVSASSSSSACTAFTTIISHKEGAADDTKQSDVRIEYLSDEDIKDSVEEQARRYRFAFPRKIVDTPTTTASHEKPDDPDDASVHESDVDEEEEAAIDDLEQEQVLNGGKTAKEFFEIIFGTAEDNEMEKRLSQILQNEDIEHDEFYETCLTMAKQQLGKAGAADGFTQHTDVDDENLENIREEAEDLWPLVSSVHITTGHRVLKNNIRVLDLPGYGDKNQIRTALIDKFRNMASFEIVVVPAERLVSSVTQNNYLMRSIRRLGAKNTLLVANKSDQLYNDLDEFVRKTKKAPFIELARYARLARNSTVDIGTFNKYKSYVRTTARTARIQHEAHIIKSKMHDKGVQVLLVSARQYRLCMEADHGSEISPVATGIPSLRHSLLKLPARENYRTLRYHIFETLPDIVKQMHRIFEKFDEDVVYAGMRKELREQLPATRERLDKLILHSVKTLVARPWNRDEQLCIVQGLNDFANLLRHGLVYYATFVKMLKENGIPVNGVAARRNLNREILLTMSKYTKAWTIEMKRNIPGILVCLHEPVQILLGSLRVHLESETIDPELRRRANEALATTKRRIEMATINLGTKLQATLHENYVLFTTEVNVKCPIAVEMKPIYHSALAKIGGKGAYRRANAQLRKRLIKSNKIHQSLPDIMAAKIVETQRISWGGCCSEYVTEVMTLLEGFQQITDELLDSEGFIKAENVSLRDRLRPLLPGFEESLASLKLEIPDFELKKEVASGKRKRVEE